MISRSRRLADDGASSVEYGLVITGIAALIVLAVFAFGGATKTLFGDTSKCLSTHTAAAC